jgi:hypothetical protein
MGVKLVRHGMVCNVRDWIGSDLIFGCIARLGKEWWHRIDTLQVQGTKTKKRSLLSQFVIQASPDSRELDYHIPMFLRA